MSLKTDIKKAITANSKKFIASKVESIKTESTMYQDSIGQKTMWIEVTVRFKKQPNK